MAGVEHEPHAKPRHVCVDKDQAPRKSGDGVGEAVLYASRLCGLFAKIDNRANVALNYGT